MAWKAQPTWALRNVHVNTQEQSVEIEASAQGLTAFFLSLMGMPTTASFTAGPAGAHLETSEFSGQTRTYCSRQHIATSFLVDAKPVELLVLGILFLPLCGAGLIFIIFYFFAKNRVTIGVGTAAGTVESIKLKASASQRSQLEEAIQVIESLVQGEASAGQAGQAAAPGRPALSSAPPPSPPARPGQVFVCQHCGKQLSLPNATPGQRFRCPGCQGIMQV